MKKTDLIFYFIILILLVGVVYLIHLLKSETAQCIKNPYLYGAKKMGNVDCDCTQWTNPLCPAKFYFNDTSFNPVINYCGNPNPNARIDLRDLNISN